MMLMRSLSSRISPFSSSARFRKLATTAMAAAGASPSAGAGGGPNAVHRQVRVSHILVDSDEAVQDVAAQLKGGADFASLAKARSKCGSARRGGELGWLARGPSIAYTPEFEAAAFAAPVGVVTTVETHKGHHAILVVADKFEASVQQMSALQLAELLGDMGLAEDVQFVDVREQFEFDTARLPRFELLPLSTFQEWAPKLGEGLLERGKETVVLCHHGVRSMQLARHLVAVGFTDVTNVEGGIHAFSQVDPRVPMY